MNKIILFLLLLSPLLAKAADFYIAKPGQQPATIVVDTTDWTGVRLATRDLSADIGRVCGKAAPAERLATVKVAVTFLVGIARSRIRRRIYVRSSPGIYRPPCLAIIAGLHFPDRDLVANNSVIVKLIAHKRQRRTFAQPDRQGNPCVRAVERQTFVLIDYNPAPRGTS